jgi:signal transduction histidine kinase
MELQIEHMEPLLDDLTLLHGQVLGPLELNRQPVAFSAWLRRHMTLWRELARQKNVGWRADVPLDLPQVEIDSDQMGRALGNLLSNAVKFTPSGGSILVEAGLSDEENLDTGGLAWIRISDGGPGIPTEEQEQIFEPFQRGGAGHRFPQGMGLGLAIARDIARAHGGDITVKSTPEDGSRFTLAFPVTSRIIEVPSPQT